MQFRFDQIEEALDRYQDILAKEEKILQEETKDAKGPDFFEKLPSTGDLDQSKKDEPIEVGLFYTLNCDIKASDDMIKRKYLERT